MAGSRMRGAAARLHSDLAAAGIIDTGDGATGRRRMHEAFWDLAFNAMLAEVAPSMDTDKAGERPAAMTVRGESR